MRRTELDTLPAVMPNVSFTNLAIVAAVAFGLPLLLGFAPRLRLLSLLFSREATSTGTQIVLIGGFLLLAIAIAFGVLRAERSMRLTAVLQRLQDTSAQIADLAGQYFDLLAVVLGNRWRRTGPPA